MATLLYSGRRNEENRSVHNRGAKVPPLGHDRNAYYGSHEQILVVTVEFGAMFIHGRRGTLYFYKEEVEVSTNA